MNRAIFVKYAGPTNTKGARVTAKCGDVKITVAYPHELSGSDVWRFAATELMRQEGWPGELFGAMGTDGHAYVFILVA